MPLLRTDNVNFALPYRNSIPTQDPGYLSSKMPIQTRMGKKDFVWKLNHLSCEGLTLRLEVLE